MSKKLILVTGGNRGIGKEIARQLAAKDHKVLLSARNLGKAKAVAGAMDGNVIPVQLDVTDQASIHRLVKEIEQQFGHLDVLINNAGIGVGNKGAVDANFEEVRQIMDTNFYGPWQLSAAFIPLLKKSSDGRIINMSSGMGALDSLTGGYAGYRLSKTSLNALTILMSNELSGSGISVNAMCPGWVRTDMGGSNAARSVEQGADTAVWLATANDVGSGKFFRDRSEIDW